MGQLNQRFLLLRTLLNALEVDERGDRYFTVDDLYRRTSMNPHTIRTVLSRNVDLFEKTTTEKRGGRGGQYIRYKLSGENAARVEREVVETRRSVLEDELVEEFEALRLPVPLLAAQEALLEKLPEATPSETDGTMEAAGRYLDLAAEELQDVPEGEDSLALCLLDVLYKLHQHHTSLSQGEAVSAVVNALSALDSAVRGLEPTTVVSVLKAALPGLKTCMSTSPPFGALNAFLLQRYGSGFGAKDLSQYLPSLGWPQQEPQLKSPGVRHFPLPANWSSSSEGSLLQEWEELNMRTKASAVDVFGSLTSVDSVAAFCRLNVLKD